MTCQDCGRTVHHGVGCPIDCAVPSEHCQCKQRNADRCETVSIIEYLLWRRNAPCMWDADGRVLKRWRDA